MRFSSAADYFFGIEIVTPSLSPKLQAWELNSRYRNAKSLRWEGLGDARLPARMAACSGLSFAANASKF